MQAIRRCAVCIYSNMHRMRITALSLTLNRQRMIWEPNCFVKAERMSLLVASFPLSGCIYRQIMGLYTINIIYYALYERITTTHMSGAIPK